MVSKAKHNPLPDSPQCAPKAEFTPEKIISWISRCMPNASHIDWLDVGSAQMIFDWRGRKFQINVSTLHVMEIEGALNVGSNEAALIEALLTKKWLMESRAK